jgi:hypothetical protein
MTEANFSNKNLGVGGAIIISAWLTHKDNGTMTSLDLSRNRLKAGGAKILAEGLKGNQVMTMLNIANNALVIASNGYSIDMSGVIALANTIKDMGALLVFDISANSIGAPGLKIISEALEGNATMTNLNVANNAATNPMDRSGRTDDISGVVALTNNAIKDMGALTSLDLSNNNIGQLVMSDGWQFDEDADEYWKEVDGEEIVETQIPAGEQLATESPVGAIAIANAVEDMGAISSVNVLGNGLGKEGAEVLGSAWKNHSTLKTICGALDRLDLPGKLGDDLPVVLVELKYNGAISTVIVNTFPLPIQDIKSKSELDFAGKGLKVEDAIIIAASIPSNVSRTMFCRPYCH